MRFFGTAPQLLLVGVAVTTVADNDDRKLCGSTTTLLVGCCCVQLRLVARVCALLLAPPALALVLNSNGDEEVDAPLSYAGDNCDVC